MRFSFDGIDPKIGYKLITATVTPRPIAWVTSMSSSGVLNAAPFSFFNVVGKEPPVIALGITNADDRILKDTAQNILETNEFVINLVNEDVVEKMNFTAMNAPHSFSEVEALGLETSPSYAVKPPHIKEAPVSLECVSLTTLTTGPRQILVVGRIVEMRVDEAYVIDAESGYIDTPKLNLVSRMQGNFYAKSTDYFEKSRPTYEQWCKSQEK